MGLAIRIRTLITNLAGVKDARKCIPHGIAHERPRRSAARCAAMPHLNRATVHFNAVLIKQVGNRAIRMFTAGVIFKGQPDDLMIDRVQDEPLPIAPIGLAVIGTITSAIRIGAV